jgi:hypothetical protein
MVNSSFEQNVLLVIPILYKFGILPPSFFFLSLQFVLLCMYVVLRVNVSGFIGIQDCSVSSIEPKRLFGISSGIHYRISIILVVPVLHGFCLGATPRFPLGTQFIGLRGFVIPHVENPGSVKLPMPVLDPVPYVLSLRARHLFSRDRRSM